MKKRWSAKTGTMMIINLICIMFYLFQWNARSLIANGQEFKNVTAKERTERIDQGGGCSTFVKKGIQNRRIEVKTELECVVIEVFPICGKSLLIFYITHTVI